MTAEPAPQPVSHLNAQALEAAEAVQDLTRDGKGRAARALALQALAHATSLAMANAAQAQAQMQQIAAAATAAIIADINRAGPASTNTSSSS